MKNNNIEVNDNQEEDLQKRIYSMWYAPNHMLIGEEREKNIELADDATKTQKEQLGLATFLSVFNYQNDKDNEQDSETLKEVHKNYQKEYKEFIKPEEKWKKMDLVSTNDDPDQKKSILKDSKGNEVGSVTFKIKKIGTNSVYDLGELDSDGKKSKGNTLIKMSMYDEKGNTNDNLSIVVGIDKTGKKFISAPADIILDGVKMTDNVKINREGKEYFMPITYQQYQDLHNEMMFGKDNTKAKFNSIEERILDYTKENVVDRQKEFNKAKKIGSNIKSQNKEITNTASNTKENSRDKDNWNSSINRGSSSDRGAR